MVFRRGRKKKLANKGHCEAYYELSLDQRVMVDTVIAELYSLVTNPLMRYFANGVFNSLLKRLKGHNLTFSGDNVAVIAKEVWANTSRTCPKLDIDRESYSDHMEIADVILQRLDSNMVKGVIAGYIQKMETIMNTDVNNSQDRLIEVMVQEAIPMIKAEFKIA